MHRENVSSNKDDKYWKNNQIKREKLKILFGLSAIVIQITVILVNCLPFKTTYYAA